jgi:hypothetical protein
MRRVRWGHALRFARGRATHPTPSAAMVGHARHVHASWTCHPVDR